VRHRGEERLLGGAGADCNTALAPLVRERQDLVTEWQVKEKELIADRSEPPAQREPDAEKSLSDRLAMIDTRLKVIDAQFAREFPNYASFSDLKPTSVAEGQRLAALTGQRRGVPPLILRSGLADAGEIRSQVPLPETADELCAVARDLGASDKDVWLGNRATEAEIKRLSEAGELSKYRIVHFATHGALAGQVGVSSEPGLILTPPATATERDDGYLSASEIAQLKLDADWVILSACNTAAGNAEGAAPLSGLARAFFYAGARALLVSHWAVASGPTVKLITGAVGRMSSDKRIGRAEAMRQSMLALIDKGENYETHPAFWAPFVVVGEGATQMSEDFHVIKKKRTQSAKSFPLTTDQERALQVGQEFKECANGCPTMVVVPAGTFIMGSPESERDRQKAEGPQQEVTIARPFAVSKFDVTFYEWDLCTTAGVCPSALDSGWGRGNRPVINVSWDDAKTYASWLSRLTGKDYRLLSEAEFEYAGRAGSTTRYPWGDEIGENNANCNYCLSQWDGDQTAPVGSFKPNKFGHYDMQGNTFKWVEDCGHSIAHLMGAGGWKSSRVPAELYGHYAYSEVAEDAKRIGDAFIKRIGTRKSDVVEFGRQRKRAILWQLYPDNRRKRELARQ
jgi:formylglycine-generating enzyme required for sulfatase activity